MGAVCASSNSTIDPAAGNHTDGARVSGSGSATGGIVLAATGTGTDTAPGAEKAVAVGGASRQQHSQQHQRGRSSGSTPLTVDVSPGVRLSKSKANATVYPHPPHPYPHPASGVSGTVGTPTSPGITQVAAASSTQRPGQSQGSAQFQSQPRVKHGVQPQHQPHSLHMEFSAANSEPCACAKDDVSAQSSCGDFPNGKGSVKALTSVVQSASVPSALVELLHSAHGSSATVKRSGFTQHSGLDSELEPEKSRKESAHLKSDSANRQNRVAHAVLSTAAGAAIRLDEAIAKMFSVMRDEYAERIERLRANEERTPTHQQQQHTPHQSPKTSTSAASSGVRFSVASIALDDEYLVTDNDSAIVVEKVDDARVIEEIGEYPDKFYQLYVPAGLMINEKEIETETSRWAVKLIAPAALIAPPPIPYSSFYEASPSTAASASSSSANSAIVMSSPFSSSSHFTLQWLYGISCPSLRPMLFINSESSLLYSCGSWLIKYSPACHSQTFLPIWPSTDKALQDAAKNQHNAKQEKSSMDTSLLSATDNPVPADLALYSSSSYHTDFIICMAQNPANRDIVAVAQCTTVKRQPAAADGKDGSATDNAFALRPCMVSVINSRAGHLWRIPYRPLPKSSIRCLAFSQNGVYLSLVSDDRPQSMKIIDWIKGGNIIANALCLDGYSKTGGGSMSGPAGLCGLIVNVVWKNNDEFVTVGIQHIVFWALRSGQLEQRAAVLRFARYPLQSFYCAAFTNKGRCLVGAADGSLYVFFNGIARKRIFAHQAAINAVVANDRLIVTAGGDGTIRSWDMTLQALTTFSLSSSIFPSRPANIQNVLLSPLSNGCVVVADGGEVFELDSLVRRDPPRLLLRGHSGGCPSVAVDVDRRNNGLIVSVAADNQILLIDSRAHRVLISNQISPFPVLRQIKRTRNNPFGLPPSHCGSAVTFSNCGSIIAAATENGDVHIFAASGLQRLAALALEHAKPPKAASAESKGPTSAMSSKSLRVQCIRFDPSGKLLAVAFSNTLAFIALGMRSRAFARSSPRCPNPSQLNEHNADSALLNVNLSDVINLESDDELSPFQLQLISTFTHAATVTAMDWSSDGDYLRVLSSDVRLSFYRAESSGSTISIIPATELPATKCWHSATALFAAIPAAKPHYVLPTCSVKLQDGSLFLGDNYGDLHYYPETSITSNLTSFPSAIRLHAHARAVHQLCVGPDDSFLLSSGSKDGGLMQWNFGKPSAAIRTETV